MAFDWNVLESVEREIDIVKTRGVIKRLVSQYWSYKTRIIIQGEQHTTSTLKPVTGGSNRMYSSQMDKVTEFKLDPTNKYIAFIREFERVVALLADDERELFRRFFLEGETGVTIAREMKLTERRYYRLRDETTKTVAMMLGVEVYE